MSLALLAILEIFFHPAATQTDDSEKTETVTAVINEAISDWQRWRELETHLSGRAHYEGWGYQDDARLKHNEKNLWISFKRNGPLFIGVIQRDGHADAFVIADGPRYGFSLSRAAESSPWIMRNLAAGRPTPPDTYLSKAHNLAAYLEVPTRLEGIPLEDLLRDPRLQVRTISRTGRDDSSIVRIAFEMPPEATGARFHDAWVELSPKLNWAITRAEYSRWSYSRTFVTNEYRSAEDGRVSLYQCSERALYPEQKVEEHRRYTFEKIEVRDVPDSEFTLSAFGLPEPGVGPASLGVPIHYWLYAVAAGLFIAALLLKRKVSRT